MRILFLIASLLLTVDLCAQADDELSWKNAFKFGGPPAITAGYTYQNYDQVIDLGIKKYNTSFFGCDGPGWAFTDINAGAEIWYNNKIAVAPKVGFGLTVIILRFDLSVIGYNQDFTIWRPAITPEIGFSFPLWNFVSITGGYNLYLNNSPIMTTQTFRASIKANIPFFSNYFSNKKRHKADTDA